MLHVSSTCACACRVGLAEKGSEIPCRDTAGLMLAGSLYMHFSLCSGCLVRPDLPSHHGASHCIGCGNSDSLRVGERQGKYEHRQID
jgi:hypothetical protein